MAKARGKGEVNCVIQPISLIFGCHLIEASTLAAKNKACVTGGDEEWNRIYEWKSSSKLLFQLSKSMVPLQVLKELAYIDAIASPFSG